MLEWLGAAIYTASVLITASLTVFGGVFGEREISILNRVDPSLTRVNEYSVSIAEFKRAERAQENVASTSEEPDLKPAKEEITSAPAAKITTPIKEIAQSAEPQPAKKPAEVPIPSPKKAPKQLTADQFLNRTQIILKQRLNGTYWPELQTALADLGDPILPSILKWDPKDKAAGGTGSIPKFETSFSCTPNFDEEPKTIYSTIIFKIRTSYSCELILKDSAGKFSKKQLNFNTGLGILQVSETSGATNRLKGTGVSHGIRFFNTDSEPINIQSINFDINSDAVHIINPAAIRFADIDDKVLDKYFLEDLMKEKTGAYSFAAKNAAANLNMTIEPNSGKVIYIQLANINYLYVDSDPTINLSINKISLSNDLAIVSLPIKNTWSCITKYLPEDTNSMCK